MTARKLRAVKPGDAPEIKKILSLAEAVESGDYLEILKAQRRDIAVSIPDEKGPAKAALHRQLSIVAKEIELLEARLTDEAEEAEFVGDEAWDEAAI